MQRLFKYLNISAVIKEYLNI